MKQNNFQAHTFASLLKSSKHSNQLAQQSTQAYGRTANRRDNPAASSQHKLAQQYLSHSSAVSLTGIAAPHPQAIQKNASQQQTQVTSTNSSFNPFSSPKPSDRIKHKKAQSTVLIESHNNEQNAYEGPENGDVATAGNGLKISIVPALNLSKLTPTPTGMMGQHKSITTKHAQEAATLQQN